MKKELKKEEEKQEQSAKEVTSKLDNMIEVEVHDNESNDAACDKSQENALGEADQETGTAADNTESSKKARRESSKKDDESISFMELLVANFADVTAISALTFILLFLTELILGLIGYIVKDKLSIYLIIFIITSIIYAPVCAKTKLRATIGQKLFFLEVKKDN